MKGQVTAERPGPKLTQSQIMRMAFGPGYTFVGPTESILRTVSCPRASSDRPNGTRYCLPRGRSEPR